MFKTVNKIFTRSYLLMLIYSAFIVFTVYYTFSKAVRGVNMLQNETMLLPFSMYAFVLFAFLTYEYCSKCKSCLLEECLKATKKGYGEVLFSQFKVITLLISVFAAVMLAAYIVLCVKSGALISQYFFRMLLGVLLNYFLVPFTGAAFGMFLSAFSKRLISYLLLVFITLIGSPLNYGLDIFIYETAGIDISPFLRMFDFYTPSLNWVAVFAYGHTILPHRWALCLFWCLLIFGIMLYKTSNQRTAKQLAKSVPAFVVSVICFAIAVMPSSKVVLESCNPIESVDADMVYYDKYEEDEDKTAYADFSVTEYDAELSAFTRLNADVHMKINNPSLDEYIFTLYHGYKLKSVRDENGKHLDYEQNGDYITVFGNGNVNEMHMKYAGFSTQFYSNVQGLFLPGYFPYLPHSGFLPVYDRQIQGVNRFYFDEGTIFNIKVNGLGRVYSNLQETDKNTFSGTGESVSLLRGLYTEYESNGVRVVYPYLNPNVSESIIDEYLPKYKGTDCMNNIKTVLIEPNVNLVSRYNQYASYSDYIISAGILGLDSLYSDQLTVSNKYSLHNLFACYSESDASGRAELEKMAQEMPESIFSDFLNYLDYYGEEEGSERIEAFLNDEEDTRTDKQFFADEKEVMQ